MADAPRPSVKIQLSAKQAQAMQMLASDDVTELLYGGARGGGKTRFGCIWAQIETNRIISMANLKPSGSPVPVGLIVRETCKDLEDTVIPSWEQTIPRGNYVIRGMRGQREIVVLGTASILLRGCEAGEHALDARQKFKGVEVCWAWMEQAEEISRDAAGEIRLTRRAKPNGVDVPHKLLLTANPAPGWVRDEFVTGSAPGRVYLPALPRDNPFLDAKYIDEIKRAYAHRPDILKAYLEGAWDSMSRPDQVILDAWLDDACHRQIFRAEDKNWLSCDPALYGDDECVIYRWHNGRVVEEVFFGQRDATFIASKLHTMAIAGYGAYKPATAIALDTCGLGGPIGDMLTEMSGGAYVVHRINGAAAPSDPERYHNLRAEVWDHAAKVLQSGDIDADGFDDRLRSQLCTPKYELRRGKLLIEPKSEVKKRIGTSPDRADCWVYGVWAWQFVHDSVDDTGVNGSNARRNRRMESASWMAI